MQNNRLSKEEEAAYVDSFFLPGGILDDFDEQGKEEATSDEHRFFVPPLPVSSNPWDAASASAIGASAIPSVVSVANNDTIVELEPLESPWLGSDSQSKPPLRRPPGLLPEPEPDPLPSIFPTPLPPEIERIVDNGLLQGLGVSHDLPPMMSHSALDAPATTAKSQHPSDISLGSAPLLASDSPLLAPDSPLLAPGYLQNDTDFEHEHSFHDLFSSSSAEAATILKEMNTDPVRSPVRGVEPIIATGIDALHNLQVFGDDQVASLMTGDELIYNGSPLHEPTSPMDSIYVPTIFGDDQVASLSANETIYDGSPLNEPTSPVDPIHVPTPQRQAPPPVVTTELDVKKVEAIDLEDDADQQPLVAAPVVTDHPPDLQENAISVSSVTRVKDATYDSESSTKVEAVVENGFFVPKVLSDVVEEKLWAAEAEKRGRTNAPKLDTKSSRGDASLSSSATDEDKRSIPATKKPSSISDQLETKWQGTSTTGVPSKIPVSAPRVSLPILGFLEDALMATMTTTITLFKWLASAIHGVSDAYEILVLVFRQVFTMVGFLGVAVAKILFLVACGLRNVGKYAKAEAQHKDRSAACYLMLYLTPRVCSLLMILVDLPQCTPHVISHILIFVICRQPEPDALIVTEDSKPRRYESSGINERQASDICAIILRTIRILLPLNFIWDGFEKEIVTFLRFSGPVRMLLAFLLALVRGRLILSPVAWVSWSAQVLATAYCPRGLVLDSSLLLWGLASIHLVRSLDTDNIIRLQDTKSLHVFDKKSS
jgi:hypothetical protein